VEDLLRFHRERVAPALERASSAPNAEAAGRPNPEGTLIDALDEGSRTLGPCVRQVEQRLEGPADVARASPSQWGELERRLDAIQIQILRIEKRFDG